MPELVPDSLESIAAALLSMPKPDERRYLAQQDADG